MAYLFWSLLRKDRHTLQESFILEERKRQNASHPRVQSSVRLRIGVFALPFKQERKSFEIFRGKGKMKKNRDEGGHSVHTLPPLTRFFFLLRGIVRFFVLKVFFPLHQVTHAEEKYHYRRRRF